MSQIDISQWKEFKVGKLFDVIMPRHVPNKSELAIKADHIHKYPLINAQTINNGIAGFALSNNNIITDVPALTIGSRGSMESFVQENPFILGNSCIGLIPKFKHVTLTTLLFLASNIFTTNYKGHNGYQHYPTKTRLEKKDYIFLPVDSNGDPDWQYMDTYIANLTALAHKNVSSLKEAKSKPAKLNIDQWGEFKLSELFEPEFTDGDNKVGQLEEDDTGVNLIGPLNSNNGILGKFISNTKIFPKNTLTWDMFGTCYWQKEPYQTVSHGHVLVLNPKVQINSASLLYLATILTKLGHQKQFGYTNMLTINKYNKLYVKLPIDAKGKPDWEYMSNQVCHFATLSNLTITSLRSVI